MDNKLYRSNIHKVFGGVCGGLAEYFDVDAVFIRALFIIMFIAGGTGLLAYIILWILLPKKSIYFAPHNAGAGFTHTSSDAYNKHSAYECGDDTILNSASKIQDDMARKRRKDVFGIILIVIGLLLLLDNILPDNYFSYWWPLILIGIGIYKLYSNKSPQKQNNHITE